MLIRVRPESPGRLAKVRLSDFTRSRLLTIARRLREQRWEKDLRPDIGYSPEISMRYDALLEAVELQRAALSPSSRSYYVSEQTLKENGA